MSKVKIIKRSPNFTPEEKNVLLSLVEHYKNVIENKKTDAVTNTSKNETWEKIALKFNASSLTSRSSESLWKFYEKLKAEARKNAAEDRKERYLTGGGPEPKKVFNSQDDLLLSLMDNKSLYGMTNNFDGDRLELASNSKENEISMEYFENYDILSDEDTTLQMNSEGTQNIAQSMAISPVNVVKTSWKKYKPGDSGSLRILCPNTATTSKEPNVKPGASAGTSLEKNILSTTPASRRRPDLARTLTSSVLSEQYNILLKKRIAISDVQEKLLTDQVEREKIEHALRVKKLELEISLLEKQNEE